MKSTTTLTIGYFRVRGKYKNGKNFEDYTFKTLFQPYGTKIAKDEIRKDYGKYNCIIADIRLVQTETAKINLAGEYLEAQKNSIAGTDNTAMEKEDNYY